MQTIDERIDERTAELTDALAKHKKLSLMLTDGIEDLEAILTRCLDALQKLRGERNEVHAQMAAVQAHLENLKKYRISLFTEQAR